MICLKKILFLKQQVRQPMGCLFSYTISFLDDQRLGGYYDNQATKMDTVGRSGASI